MSVELMPVEWQPMPTAQKDAPAEDLLVSLLKHEISSFEVAAEDDDLLHDEALEVHKSQVKFALRSLRRLFPLKAHFVREFGVQNGFDIEETGPFHNDFAATLPEKRRGKPLKLPKRSGLAIWTAVDGDGLVISAGRGTNPEKMLLNDGKFEYGPESMGSDKPDHPHSLLKSGLVNPELTSNVMSVAPYKTGDTIFMIEGGRESTWHRYMTSPELDYREFILTTISDRNHGRLFLPNFRPGYDL